MRLPAGLIWRKKAQFDEGSGTVDALEQAFSDMLGFCADRQAEAKICERLLRDQ